MPSQFLSFMEGAAHFNFGDSIRRGFLTALSINLVGLWLRMVNDPTHRWRYLRDR